MAAQKLVVVGTIAGAHGVRGNVKVRSFTAEPKDIFSYGPLLTEAGEVVIEPKEVAPSKSLFIVTPVSPRQKEEWDAMKGTRLYIPRDSLPETEPDAFYIDDLVGLSVHAGGPDPIGRVKAVQDFGAGDIVEIQLFAGGKSLLIPFTREDVPTVDMDAKRIVIADISIWQDDDTEEDST